MYNILMVVVLLSLLFFLIDIYSRGAVRGYINRKFFKPDILTKYEFVDLDKCDFPDKEKVRFFSIYKSSKGNAYIKYTSDNIEGYPIRYYFIVENGKITIVSDSTRDKYGCRDYYILSPKDIGLTFCKNGKFIDWQKGCHAKRLFLRVFLSDPNSMGDDSS